MQAFIFVSKWLAYKDKNALRNLVSTCKELRVYFYLLVQGRKINYRNRRIAYRYPCGVTHIRNTDILYNFVYLKSAHFDELAACDLTNFKHLESLKVVVSYGVIKANPSILNIMNLSHWEGDLEKITSLTIAPFVPIGQLTANRINKMINLTHLDMGNSKVPINCQQIKKLNTNGHQLQVLDADNIWWAKIHVNMLQCINRYRLKEVTISVYSSSVVDLPCATTVTLTSYHASTTKVQLIAPCVKNLCTMGVNCFWKDPHLLDIYTCDSQIKGFAAKKIILYGSTSYDGLNLKCANELILHSCVQLQKTLAIEKLTIYNRGNITAATIVQPFIKNIQLFNCRLNKWLFPNAVYVRLVEVNMRVKNIFIDSLEKLVLEKVYGKEIFVYHKVDVCRI